MKNQHKAGIVGIIYSAILVLVITLVKDFDLAIYALLGSAVSLFNYAQLLTATKKITAAKMVFNVILRFSMIAIVLIFVALETDYDVTSLIMTLLGLVASKVGVIVVHLLFKKKEVENDA